MLQTFTRNRKSSGLFSATAYRLVYNQESLKELLQAPFEIDAIKKQALIKKNTYPKTHRLTLHEVISEQYYGYSLSTKTQQNIAALKNENTFTITTGHQLNLFTGPLYVIYKILHVINLTETLNLENDGNTYVPVFWMATEDHDFEEINHATVFGKKISWEEKQNGPVGHYDLNQWEVLQSTLHDLFAKHPDSEIHSIIDRYDGANFAEATKQLVHYLFNEYGLIIIEPNDKKLKKLFTSYLKEEITTKFVEKSVSETFEVMEQLQIKPQANPRPINLFYIKKGVRDRIIPNANGSLEIQALGNLSLDQLNLLIEQSPEKFSPNVLMRPLYQEKILPNLVYVGGAGEINYWMQLKSSFEHVEQVFPLIQVRLSALLIEPTIQKKWLKLGFSWDELFKPTSDLQKEYIKKNNHELLDFTSLEDLTEQLIAQLNQQILSVDTQLTKFSEAESSKLTKQIDSIKEKLVKHQKTHFEQAMKQIEDIHLKLFGTGSFQERTDNFFSFCPTGEIHSKIEALKNVLNPLEKDLQIVLLDT
jgi:bacillithiol biosynthesis cysteine-adding enzyme BshC